MIDFIRELSIDGVHCQLEIEGTQGREYKIRIAPVTPWPDNGETAALMLKSAGLNRTEWTSPGPFDPVSRRNLLEILEYNYQRETLPTDKEPKELRKVIRKLTAHYVNPAIAELSNAGFPDDAIPHFRQFAEEDYAFTIGLTIAEFWEWKREQK